MKSTPARAGRVRNAIWEAGLLVALPLVFYRGVAEQFSTPKFFLMECLVVAGVAVCSLGRLWIPRTRALRLERGLPVLAFSAAVVISCAASPVPRFSLLQAEYILCGPAWFLLLTSWEHGEAAARKILVLITLAGGLVAAIAVFQDLGYDPVLMGGYQVDWGAMAARMRVYSTLGNPNFVGGYLIGTIFAAAALAAAARTRWTRALGWSAVIAMLAAIGVTGSRGAWLGLAVGAAAALGVILPKRDGQRQRAASSFAGARAFVPPSACALAAMLSLSLAERLTNRAAGRIYLWRFSWPLFWRHPVMGSGAGSYQLAYLELQGRFLAAHPAWIRYWTNNRLLHNDPLQLLLETGLLGFAAFLWVLWDYRRAARQASLKAANPWARYAIAASAGGVTAVLVDSLFNYQFAVPATYVLLFTLLVIPTLLRGGERGNDDRSPARPPSRQAWFRAALSAAIVAAAGGLIWQQGRALMSECFYQTACECEARMDLAGAEAASRRSIGLNDLNGRAHFGLSRVLYSRQRAADALTEVALAERTYADVNQEVLRALILEKMGNKRGALTAYAHALWLDPLLTGGPQDADRLRPAR